jgi:hypothetical protein
LQSNFVYLAQTDTTVGFLSSSSESLNLVKSRDESTTFIKDVSSLSTFKEHCKVPYTHKNRVRRAKKTTFIDPQGSSCRFVSSGDHQGFLEKYCVMFSTSANPAGKKYDLNFAWQQSEVIVMDKRGIFEDTPSRLIKLGKRDIRKLR